MENNTNNNKRYTITGANVEDKLSIKSDESEICIPSTARRFFTTKTLAKKISALFANYFDDFYGCYVEVKTVGNVQLVADVGLVFQMLNDDQYRNPVKNIAFTPTSINQITHINTGRDILNAINVMTDNNKIRSGNSKFKFAITQEAKDVFSDYLPISAIHNANMYTDRVFNWSNFYSPVDITSTYNGLYAGTRIVVCGLDLCKIMGDLFGHSGDHNYQYMIVPIRPIDNSNYNKLRANPMQFIAYQQQFNTLETVNSPKAEWLIAVDEYNQEVLNADLNEAFHIDFSANNDIYCEKA